MDLQIKGEVEQILEEQSGEGKNGPWRKQEFILKTGGQYPKQVCITQWGDDIDRFDVQVGENVTAHVDIQSREYNGRWYTDVKAWKVEKAEPTTIGPGSGGSASSSSSGDDGDPRPQPDFDDEAPF